MTQTADGIPPTEESVAVANVLAALGMEEYWLGRFRAVWRRWKKPPSGNRKRHKSQVKHSIGQIRHYRKRQEEIA